MPDHVCIWLGAGAWTLVIVLSNFVAAELRVKHTGHVDRLLPEPSGGPVASL